MIGKILFLLTSLPYTLKIIQGLVSLWSLLVADLIYFFAKKVSTMFYLCIQLKKSQMPGQNNVIPAY